MAGASIPALIMTYRRLDGVIRLLSSLADSGVKEVFLAIDGPRSQSDNLVQNDIEDWATEFARTNFMVLHVLRRKENLGVGAAIILSLNWFFSHVDYGMVLEDDLELSPYFVDFAKFCRDEYRDREDVWMVSGDCFFNVQPQQAGETYFLNYPLVWGWCTWSMKWNEMYSAILSEKHYQLRNLWSSDLSFWWSGARRTLSGMVDTWDIPLAYEMLVRKKITVIPSLNLVSNRGADQNAVHTHTNQFPLNFPIPQLNRSPRFIPGSMNPKSIDNFNKLHNKLVFGIRWYHILSPIKFVLARFLRRKLVPLSKRISSNS